MSASPAPGRGDDWASKCPWCAHPLHDGECGGDIHIGAAKKPETAPCPCKRHEKHPPKGQS